MFEQFPKDRPPLPVAYRAIYKSYYQKNRGGKTAASSIAQRLESWLHKQVASDVTHTNASISTLEIGAGNLNQLPYEPVSDSYDIVEPFSQLVEQSEHAHRIRHCYTDLSDVPLGATYDRIISIAALEHICDLPQVVARSGLLLSKNGHFRAAIPNEGSWLWSLGWKLTTGLEFKLNYALDYGVIMRHEHVNTAREIQSVLNYFFKSVTRKVFGVTPALSLYHFYD